MKIKLKEGENEITEVEVVYLVGKDSKTTIFETTKSTKITEVSLDENGNLTIKDFYDGGGKFSDVKNTYFFSGKCLVRFKVWKSVA